MSRALVDRRTVRVLSAVVALSLVAGWALLHAHRPNTPSVVPAGAVAVAVPTLQPVAGATTNLSDPAIAAAPSSQRAAFAAVAATSRAYFRGMDHAMHTGDVSLFVAMSDPRCKCREFATTMREIYTAGSISGGAISVTKMRVLDVSGRTSGVTVDYLMQPHTVRSHGKATLYPGYLIHASLFVWREDDETWKVGDLTRLAEDPL